MGLLIPSVYFFIAFAALWQSYRDPQVTLASLSQNVTALVFFVIFIGLGFLLIEQMSLSSYKGSAYGGYDFYLMVGFCLSWAGLSLLWFVRKMPRDKKKAEVTTYEMSDETSDDLISDVDGSLISEMRVVRPWYLVPFDYVDRCLLKIAGLCLLVVVL